MANFLVVDANNRNAAPAVVDAASRKAAAEAVLAEAGFDPKGYSRSEEYNWYLGRYEVGSFRAWNADAGRAVNLVVSKVDDVDALPEFAAPVSDADVAAEFLRERFGVDASPEDVADLLAAVRNNR